MDFLVRLATSQGGPCTLFF